MKRRPILALAAGLLALGLVAACDGPGPRTPDPHARPGQPISRDLDYAPRIASPEVWAALAARPTSEHVAHTEVVKFLLDRTDGRVYFAQSERWPIHYYFAQRFLSTAANPVAGGWVFNHREYRSPERRFVLGTVSRYADAGVWALELYAGDTLDLPATARAFTAVRDRVYFGGELRYRPVPAAQVRAIEQARALMPIVTTEEVFGKIAYQPLELGDAYGYLRVIPPGTPVDVTAFRPWDIVVLGDLPEDLPVVAGVISRELQAPLAHINVLCHNRKTPNMGLRAATEEPDIVALKDKLVHLVVGGQSFQVTAAAQADAERSWEAKRPTDVVKPPRDDRDVGMPMLSDPKAQEGSLTGAKASQLAIVAKEIPGAVPEAFCLPFHAYARFLAVNGFDKRIAAMLATPEFKADPERRKRDLEALRTAMEAGTVPPDVLGPLLARIKELLPPGRIRLRSSTNSEDLPGFNGAGLYRSARVDPANEGEVATGLKQVWASVWLWGAFEERNFYRIAHDTVGMAVLVQRSVDDQIGNGVAITANPFNQGQPGFFINTQAVGGSVTSARGDEVPEQVLYFTFEDGKGIERLSKSSRAAGGTLLTDADVEELAVYLTLIHQKFTGEPSDSMTGHAVDVEFLLQKTPRKIVIVQARPYTVTWPRGRRYEDLIPPQ